MRHPLFTDLHTLQEYSHLGDLQISSQKKEILSEVAFITGATGFIGGYLLKELIRKSQFKKYYCLVRGEDLNAANNRLKQNLLLKGLSLDEWEEAEIEVISGDILQHLFGLNEEQYIKLTQEVDQVFHFAATMNWVNPFNQNTIDNLSALRQTVHFCSINRRKRLHYASSMGLWTLLKHKSDVLLEDELHPHGDQLPGGYFQSKWVAEHILNEARVAGLTVNIYRIGDVKGSTEDGKGDANNFGNLVMHYFIKTGKAIEKSEPEFNFLPVDYVAKSIAHISANKQGGNYQFSNSELISFSDITGTLKDIGYNATGYELNDWIQLLAQDKSPLGRVLNAIFRKFTPGLDWEPTSFYQIGVDMFRRKHDTSNTEAVLSGLLPAPQMLLDGTLQKYLHHISTIEHA